MNFVDCFIKEKSILMEGALGERLKREFYLKLDGNIDMAAFVCSEKGREALGKLWSEYADIACKNKLPFLATTPTRRVNQERVSGSCYDDSVIRRNVEFLREVQARQKAKMYVGGLLGCRGDAYTGEGALRDRREARNFHEWEVSRFAEENVDFLYASLMPTIEEAAGMALAMEKYKVPYIISFTIKKDGCLVDGTSICEAISYIDSITKAMPLCYMANCVHPRIVYEALSQPFNRGKTVHERFMGIQANTSLLSYEELDGSKELRSSEPVQFAEEMLKLREIIPIKIFGGCCGTDGRHMREIAKRICH